ncbi:MAG: hypothetical protein ACYC3S_03360 [Chloroflexota bacterium]
MPDWNPLQVGLLVGLVAGAAWTARTLLKQHAIAGVWMVVELRFWRALATNFVISFLVAVLVSTLLAAVAWVIYGLLLRVV